MWTQVSKVFPFQSFDEYPKNWINSRLVQNIPTPVAIFLPSALLVLFFFPVWQNLKKYAVIYRSLEGINAAVVGIMAGATAYLLKDNIFFPLFEGAYSTAFWDIFIVMGTFILLRSNRIPAPFIVLGCLMLGALL